MGTDLYVFNYEYSNFSNPVSLYGFVIECSDNVSKLVSNLKECKKSGSLMLDGHMRNFRFYMSRYPNYEMLLKLEITSAF